MTDNVCWCLCFSPRVSGDMGSFLDQSSTLTSLPNILVVDDALTCLRPPSYHQQSSSSDCNSRWAQLQWQWAVGKITFYTNFTCLMLIHFALFIEYNYNVSYANIKFGNKLYIQLPLSKFFCNLWQTDIQIIYMAPLPSQMGWFIFSSKLFGMCILVNIYK